jgi:glycogen debranching enzyme
MIYIRKPIDLPRGLMAAALMTSAMAAEPAGSSRFADGDLQSLMTAVESDRLRTYTLTTNAELRDDMPSDRRITFAEKDNHARLRTGDLMFDGLYAMAVNEALQNSVSEVKDAAYGKGEPTKLEAFQTGELWSYVWTRDIAYSAHLALASFDPERAMNSLLFKTSRLKDSVSGGFKNQIIQDTGSGGSYPVSTDRIVWILGVSEALKYLPEPRRSQLLKRSYEILRDTIGHDRRVIYDPDDGLYRGEQSFLDWREQTYPGWTRDNVVAIAASKSLSVNVAYEFALRTAADYAERLGQRDERDRFTKWADALREAIDRGFHDPESGLYSTLLLANPAHAARTNRYDLLGSSLALLLGTIDGPRATAMLEAYPSGPYGPPVVWPQDPVAPIYHNQAIWPFVTAYWTKAGRRAGSVDAVERGVRSLVRGAALNLSNMENFDLASGRAWAEAGARSGPVINSRRQLWSVAGYLSMVQDVIFGLETTWDGIRFQPFVSGSLRDEMFANSKTLELDGFPYQGKHLQVRVHLPPPGTKGEGPFRIVATRLNGKPISGTDFVPATSLPDRSVWDIELAAPSDESNAGPVVPTLAVDSPDAMFAPHQPEWDKAGTAIAPVDGKPALRFNNRSEETWFNIYRDGSPHAKRIESKRWVDPESNYHASIARFYSVEAIDRRSGNASHHSPGIAHLTSRNQTVISAAAMEHKGGILTDGKYFRDWGQPEHTLTVPSLTVEQSGVHFLRAEFSNGSGPVNTGITCAIKKLELRTSDDGKTVASGYIVMPQSGDWQRFDLSTGIKAQLEAGTSYTLHISEDEYSRNMSHFAANERYTALPGGGSDSYNFVNIAAVHMTRIADPSPPNH